jgi:hypothetical protein
MTKPMPSPQHAACEARALAAINKKFWFSLLTVVSLVIIASVPAFAWNDEGHMASAYLAYQRLNPSTRDRVDALLTRNPYYPKWLAALPAGTSKTDAKMMIFMIASIWPDQIRSDPDYRDDGPNNGNSPPDGPTGTLNIGYSDHLRHKYWHFIDIPFSQDGTPLPPVPAPNIQTQIAAFRAALASQKSDDIKSYDLVWLQHLVGDVHQPLHAVTRITVAQPNGDAGGNGVQLCSAPCRDGLHFFWDRLIGSQSSIAPPPLPALNAGAAPSAADFAAELQSAILAARRLPAPDPDRAKITDESAWVNESYEAAKQYVYVAPIGPAAGPYAVTPAYFEKAKSVAADRVALAGARLAKLLNGNLK